MAPAGGSAPPLSSVEMPSQHRALLEWAQSDQALVVALCRCSAMLARARVLAARGIVYVNGCARFMRESHERKAF